MVCDKNTGKDSIRKRYIYKLSTNFVGAFIGSLAMVIIPRSLGSKVYGDINFLISFFNELITFLDTGTSTGFYTKLSQRQKESEMVIFYFYFMAVVGTVLTLFILIACITPVYTVLWPGQEVKFIVLAGIWGILTWTAQILNKLADAYGLTSASERVKIIQKVIGLAAITILYFFSAVTAWSFFCYNYLILFFSSIAFLMLLKGYIPFSKKNWILTLQQIKKYTREFYQYSHPLFSYSLVGLLVGLGDRWLLQSFSGSTEQGFYGLAYQISAVCIIFSSAIIPLLNREFAIASFNKDASGMISLFRNYVPVLYSTSVLISCFIATQADMLIYIIGGAKFKDAGPAVTIMAVFPIMQTHAQMTATFFYATDRTHLYRNIGIFFMLLGLPVTYFLIAPTDYFGLHAGATGLAVKMLVLSFFPTNVRLFFITKYLGLSFGKYLLHQFVCTGAFWGIGSLSTVITDRLLTSVSPVIRFLFTGILYILQSVVLIYCFPEIVGLNRQRVNVLAKHAFVWIRK